MSDSYTPFAPIKYDQQAVSRQGWGMAASGPSDDRLIVGFYPKSIVNVAASRAAGKRICETKDYVKIQHPGETLNVLDRPVIVGYLCIVVILFVAINLAVDLITSWLDPRVRLGADA